MEVGVIINQYRVVEHIGRGGMADVWSARDQRLNRMVAIKTIQASLAAQHDPVAMFEREAKTIAALEHPNILPIYDFGEYESQLYIVMRYVSGGSLEDVIERGPMNAAEVLRVGAAVAGALDYAHGNKVVHLDLKPPNIMLDTHNSPYLADFGLAAALGPEGRAANPGSGTLLYMAPEQMTAEVIDHRADIFSFAIMIYHMLTGGLPYDAQVSLALKQLQYGEELPEIERENRDLPPALTYVLRRGTAMQPENRPPTLTALMDEIREVLAPSPALVAADWSELDAVRVNTNDMLTEPLVDSSDMMLLEAVDIYSRARHAWARGTGRFLLGVTHFMLISDYYSQAEKHGLDIDEAGYQMLLRGALEYDHDVDYWWSKLDDDNRRWVSLHAVRSDNAPARIRAMYRLETLPDSPDAPQIPKLVAQALQVETDAQAKIAALTVLGTRAKIMAPRPELNIKTEFRSRLLTTITRLGLEITTPTGWREAVYSPEIDQLIAETALDLSNTTVADLAARTIGRIRSLSALRHIANEQVAGTRGALRALALVRDEAPALPNIVAPQARIYAWLANTWRRLTDDVLGLVLRFAMGLLGGLLAMGGYVFITFRSQEIFTAARTGNTIAVGLVFGVFTAVMALFADELPRRLRGFWPWHVRMVVAGAFGFVWGALTWAAFTLWYLNYPPTWEIMRFGGAGLAIGFLAAGLFNLRGLPAFLLTALATFAPMYIYYTYWQIGWQVPFPTALGFGLYALFWALLGAEVPLRFRERERSLSNLVISALMGFLFGAFVIGSFQFVFEDTAPQLAPLLLVGLWTGGGFLLFNFLPRLSETLTLVGVAAVMLAAAVMARFGAWVQPLANGEMQYLLNNFNEALLYLDLPAQTFTLLLPMAALIAFGAHGHRLMADVLAWIGETRTKRERSAGLTAYLGYVIPAGVLLTIIAALGLGASYITGVELIRYNLEQIAAGERFWSVFALAALVILLTYIFDSALSSIVLGRVRTGTLLIAVAAVILLSGAPLAYTGGLLLGIVALIVGLLPVLLGVATVIGGFAVWRWKAWGVYVVLAGLAFYAASWLLNTAPALLTFSVTWTQVFFVLGSFATIALGVYAIQPNLPYMQPLFARRDAAPTPTTTRIPKVVVAAPHPALETMPPNPAFVSEHTKSASLAASSTPPATTTYVDDESTVDMPKVDPNRELRTVVDPQTKPDEKPVSLPKIQWKTSSKPASKPPVPPVISGGSGLPPKPDLATVVDLQSGEPTPPKVTDDELAELLDPKTYQSKISTAYDPQSPAADEPPAKLPPTASGSEFKIRWSVKPDNQRDSQIKPTEPPEE